MHPSFIEKEFRPLIISSSAFANSGTIPDEYTCMGENINPPMEVQHIPDEVKSLAVVVDDPDAPGGNWLHWLVWNIPVTQHIRENAVMGTEGINDFGVVSYRGPCPPMGTHRYFFRVYGLDDLLQLTPGASKADFDRKINNHILAYGELTGIYTLDGKKISEGKHHDLLGHSN